MLRVSRSSCSCTAIPSSALATLTQGTRPRSVLARGGLFVLVTYGGPDYRLPYLEDASLDWDVLVYVLARRTASMSGNRTPAAGRRAGWLPWQVQLGYQGMISDVGYCV